MRVGCAGRLRARNALDVTSLPSAAAASMAVRPVRRVEKSGSAGGVVPLPSPLRGSFIDRRPTSASLKEHHSAASFRHKIISCADVSQRPQHFYLAPDTGANTGNGVRPPVDSKRDCQQDVEVGSFAYGEQLDEYSARWAAKFYGQVTFGPRNYPYPSSRWLARRFKMKKHKIIKRFRFRRYKLAAVANLPFAKMIRVGMLPELKSSKTKKGDMVDPSLSGQLVSAVKNMGDKKKGQRTRPKSKYQV
uniref:Uncharacterized protein n=1 Tax=Trypanosoma congolense (strain IL3000) TaxID=1068625 RepID=G0UPC2_TRYCI|nr:conserved hypothetical protein [Trypanosoma congolense IL3000]